MNLVSTRYGDMYIIDEDKIVSHSLSIYGEWAMDELSLFEKLILPGMNVLDVGAFIGTHSLAFSNFTGQNGKVYSFEPRKEIFDILVSNLLLNNCENVTPFNIGLGETEKYLFLESIDLNDAVNFGGLSLDSSLNSKNSDTYKINVSTIDSLNIKKIDLIKLDVEGMERHVLDGAIRTLSRDRSIVFCECNSLVSGWDIVQFSQQNQYEIYGFLCSAFNPNNFNKNKENIWGGAMELALLLLPCEKSESIIKSISDYKLFKIENIEDLVLPLLHKPQYAHEVLTTTSSNKLLGIKFPSPALMDYDSKVLSLNKKISFCENEIIDLGQATLAKTAQIIGFQENIIELQTLNSQREYFINDLQYEIYQFRSSSSWRVTAPLRWTSQKIKRCICIAKVLRRYMQTYPGINGLKRILFRCTDAIKSGGVVGLKSRIVLYENIKNNNNNNEFSPVGKNICEIDDLYNLFKNNSNVKTTIIFDHNGGGGANIYTNELLKKIRIVDESALRVYCFESVWFVQWISSNAEIIFSTLSIESLFEVMASSNSDNIIINSLYGYPDIEIAIKKIQILAKSLSAQIDFKIHDFYALCPSPHLSDFEEKYCGVPQNPDVCRSCLKKNVNWYHSWYPKENRPTIIEDWRKPFNSLLEAATSVTFFDESSIDIFRKGFNLEDKKIKIVPHVSTHFQCDILIDLIGPLHIGILGTLSHIKGGNEVRSLCNYLNDLGLKIPVTVVGHSYTELPSQVKIIGSYSSDVLPNIIMTEGINVILMLSIVPETFSYTISEAMKMELPIVAFDIGAQGNRVKKYKFGRVIPLDSSSDVIFEAIKSSLTFAQEQKK